MVGAPGHPVFTLTDHFGKQATEKDFHGWFQLVYFGFTSCRVVCPRALTKLSGVLETLGDEGARRIKPLYITVDPARDTPQAMKTFLETGYPRFLGLTGPEQAIEEAKTSFRVFAQRKSDPADPDGYQIAHTAIAYFLDPGGNYLDHFPDATEAGRIIERIRGHLAKG
ncbi:SCO family protein [Bradyrhizobium manausense]|uniref:SCO family protein n=1 Tax=Bradyrhizobium TaxID=374 RepID=UPI001BA4D21A|nr:MULTISPECIES: SCO family protein [Bradyrhizobium]MBR0825254.1 SCO family protein [Bradyrhizobium manausense]UVO28439.1 SCO family protein [Bradyrhizobium arachidis]